MQKNRNTDCHNYTHIRLTKPLPTGLDTLHVKTQGFFKRKSTSAKKLLNSAKKIHANALLMSEKTDSEIKELINEQKKLFQRTPSDCNHLIPLALTVLSEAVLRSLGIRPYPVQLAGALAISKGLIAEMATGEGKTLTAAIAGVIFGWTGKPCHIVTTNDYLAERDSNKLKPLYEFCELSTGFVIGEMEPPKRKENYNKSVTYTTSKELTADFLRDRLELKKYQQYDNRLIRAFFEEEQTIFNKDSLVMRGIHTAIIDEADSVLIDEAVTPLIISRAQENKTFSEACITAMRLSGTLVEEKHFSVNYKFKDVHLFLDKVLKHIKDEKLPAPLLNPQFLNQLLTQALTVRYFYKKNKQYIIEDEKIVIVDELSGRKMPQRSWSDGLHQMVEALEELPLTSPNETLARLSFQKFFRYFKRIGGMTGTALEASEEFWEVYNLPVVTIPRNRPNLRVDKRPKLFRKEELKWNAVVDEVKEIHKQGRPILIGTKSIKTSAKLSQLLQEQGMVPKIINAIFHKEEAQIVEKAGQKRAITVATNMAGRGTDIILGAGVKELGGLHVISTECNESTRVDRQLFGRAGRQGDPGSSSSFLDLEDELITRMLPNYLQKLLQKTCSLGALSLLSHFSLYVTQNRYKKRAYKSRKAVQKTDKWLEDSLSFTPEDILL